MISLTLKANPTFADFTLRRSVFPFAEEAELSHAPSLAHMLRTRIAPTPSGFLHIGNALSFITTWNWARAHGAELILRIDDLDAPRTQDAAVDDIFEQLQWMGIDWNEGPRNRAELQKTYSQTLRLGRYREALGMLWNAPERRVFACECSRSQVTECTCRDRGLTHVPGKTAVRLRADLDQALGDAVIWRKEDLPAYQLASVIDDLDLKISHIIRGEDLKSSTVFQKNLARALAQAGWADAEAFHLIHFMHHPLITGPAGEKLSKSAKSTSLIELRRGGLTRAELFNQLDLQAASRHLSK